MVTTRCGVGCIVHSPPFVMKEEGSFVLPKEVIEGWHGLSWGPESMWFAPSTKEQRKSLLKQILIKMTNKKCRANQNHGSDDKQDRPKQMIVLGAWHWMSQLIFGSKTNTASWKVENSRYCRNTPPMKTKRAVWTIGNRLTTPNATSVNEISRIPPIPLGPIPSPRQLAEGELESGEREGAWTCWCGEGGGRREAGARWSAGPGFQYWLLLQGARSIFRVRILQHWKNRSDLATLEPTLGPCNIGENPPGI